VILFEVQEIGFEKSFTSFPNSNHKKGDDFIATIWGLHQGKCVLVFLCS